MLHDQRIWSVSEINAHVRQLLAEDRVLKSVWVQGEIRRWQVAQSGHAYFALHDEQSQISGVIWRSHLAHMSQMPKDGEQVKVLGSIQVSRRGGEYQIDALTIVCDSMIGYWGRQFEETRHRLHSEGLFDESRKRQFPLLPERVGIVTSLDSAALRDMVRTIRDRYAGVQIVVFPSLVQGEGASVALVRAIELANSDTVRNRIGAVEVLIIGRGGGTVEDLWAFNEEIVVRAVASSHIPTVSAVGHEGDFVLTDLSADYRAATPTAAAQKVVPDRRDLLNHLAHLDTRLQQAMRQRLYHLRNGLRRLQERRCFIDPLSVLGGFWQSVDNAVLQIQSEARQALTTHRQQLLELSKRLFYFHPQVQLERWRGQIDRHAKSLHTNMRTHIERCRNTLESRLGKLEVLNPYAVLQRGYALLRDPETKCVLSRASQFVPHQQAEVVVADGSLQITVNEVVIDDES
ncbi:MAG: exodeoxyribonuclease VII large subunit [Fimbriimonadales bacterium]